MFLNQAKSEKKKAPSSGTVFAYKLRQNINAKQKRRGL